MSLIARRPRDRTHTYEDLGDIELSPQQAALAQHKIEEAERELAELRVNMRWGRSQLDTIRRAAALFGVPYQTYLKQVALRQAMTDLREAREVGAASES